MVAWYRKEYRMRQGFVILILLLAEQAAAQLKWTSMDSAFTGLPASVAVYRSTDTVNGRPSIAWCVIADLKDKRLDFTTDTAFGRRLTPRQFYEKNGQPLLVVNCTFFSFATSQNLNLVMRKGRLLTYNLHDLAGKGKDTLTYRHPLGSAIGISRKRKADIAWVYADTSRRNAYALQQPLEAGRDSASLHKLAFYRRQAKKTGSRFSKWKMQTAVGGGPVILQNGEIRITNEEEIRFTGKGLLDKHPRTAMGYTADNRLVILVVEGRNPGIAEGVTLAEEAQMLKDLGCVEGLNLDGGGSSCMLIDGQETIYPADKGVQRPVPAVFMIRKLF